MTKKQLIAEWKRMLMKESILSFPPEIQKAVEIIDKNGGISFDVFKTEYLGRSRYRTFDGETPPEGGDDIYHWKTYGFDAPKTLKIDVDGMFSEFTSKDFSLVFPSKSGFYWIDVFDNMPNEDEIDDEIKSYADSMPENKIIFVEHHFDKSQSINPERSYIKVYIPYFEYVDYGKYETKAEEKRKTVDEFEKAVNVLFNWLPKSGYFNVYDSGGDYKEKTR